MEFNSGFKGLTFPVFQYASYTVFDKTVAMMHGKKWHELHKHSYSSTNVRIMIYIYNYYSVFGSVFLNVAMGML